MLRLRYLLLPTAGLTVLIAGLGCAPTNTTPRPAVTAYTPKFQFSVPKTEIPGSAKTTIAIVTFNKSAKTFNSFNSRFVQDLQNVLVARGYNVKGPFTSVDDLTYSDKKGSDFILLYSLSGTSTFDNVQSTGGGSTSDLPNSEEARIWDGTYGSLLGVPIKNMNGNADYFHGNLLTSAKINIELDESMSGEKLWRKTVDISANPEPFDTASPHAMANGETPAIAMSKTTYWDLGMTNALNEALDSIYTNAFNTIWKQLDPEELRDLKKQADEIKSKKRF